MKDDNLMKITYDVVGKKVGQKFIKVNDSNWQLIADDIWNHMISDKTADMLYSAGKAAGKHKGIVIGATLGVVGTIGTIAAVKYIEENKKDSFDKDFD